ncbi:MAG: hypothetical protein ACOC5G_03795 [Acidobacteriota bacterium]
MSKTPDGKVIIGFSEDYSIQIHHSEKGMLSSFSHSYEPVKITQQDKKNYFSNQTYNTPKGRIETPEEVKKLTKFPKYKPAFDSLLADYEGNILVHLTQNNSEGTPPQFDAFTSQGQFIARISIKRGIQEFPYRSFFDNTDLWTI